MTPVQNNAQRAEYPLLIGPKLYIMVDDRGYCASPVKEGMLGVVIRATDVHGRGYRALKIPRLTADTVRENFFLAQLLTAEKETSHEIFLVGNAPTIHGLLPCPSSDSPIFESEQSLYRGSRKELADRELEKSLDAQSGQRVMVQFRKGMPPRFVGIKKQSEEGVELQFHPTALSQELQGWLTPEAWDDVIKTGTRGSTWLNEMLLVRRPNESYPKRDIATPIMAEVNERSDETVSWVIGAPSIEYQWAHYKLEEVVQRRLHDASWRIPNILKLAQTVLHGLISLHSRGFVHGDLRPANIMSVGDPNNARNYYLIDYAGFARHQPFGVVGNHSESSRDLSRIGNAINSGRVSPFYAEERSVARESERVETAIIIRTVSSREPAGEEPEQLAVILGWDNVFGDADRLKAIVEYVRSYLGQPRPDDLADPPPVKATAPRDETESTTRFDEGKVLRSTAYSVPPPGGSEGAGAPPDRDFQGLQDVEALPGRDFQGLQNGDRLRVREYVFEVAEDLGLLDVPIYRDEETSAGQFRVVVCHTPGWQVFHERVLLGIPTDTLFDDHRDLVRLSVPKVIELQQWTAASDVYSVGVLLLYLVFHSRAARERERSGVSSGAREQAQFEAMIDAISTPTYADFVWRRLEPLRRILETLQEGKSTHHWTGSSIAHARLVSRDEAEGVCSQAELDALPVESEENAQRKYWRPRAGVTDATSKDPTLRDRENEDDLLGFFSRGTIQITQSAPGLDRILVGVEKNLGSFVFILHFALSCIHRRAAIKPWLSSNISPDREQMRLPFCESRLDGPQHLVAQKALDRLVRIAELVNDDAFSQLLARDVIGYEPASDAALRVQKERLRRDNRDLIGKNKKLDKESRELRAKFEELNSRLGKLTGEQLKLIEKHDELAVAKARQDELTANLTRMVSEANRLNEDICQLRQQARGEIAKRCGVERCYRSKPEYGQIIDQSHQLRVTLAKAEHLQDAEH